jgi:hypothetical protein
MDHTERSAVFSGYAVRLLTAFAIALILPACSSHTSNEAPDEPVGLQVQTIPLSAGDSLQRAVDSAPEGSTLVLPPASTWRANVRIDKSLTIRGDASAPAKVYGDKTREPVILIDSSRDVVVVIEGIAVLEARGGPTDCVSVYPADEKTVCPDGVAISGNAHVHLSDVSIEGNGRMGVYATDHSYVELTRCSVSESGRIGLFVRRFAQCEAIDSRFAHNNEGVMIADSARGTLESCVIEDSASYGLYLGGQPTCTLSGSSVTGNGNNGIALAGSPTLVATGSSITGNRGWGIVKLNFPLPFAGTLDLGEGCTLDENEFSGVGTK